MTSFERRVNRLKGRIKDFTNDLNSNKFRNAERKLSKKEKKHIKEHSEEQGRKRRLEISKQEQDAETIRKAIGYEVEALRKLAELIGSEGLRIGNVSDRLQELRKGLVHATSTSNEQKRSQILVLVAQSLNTVGYEATLNAKIRAIIGDLKKEEIDVIKDFEAEASDITAIQKDLRLSGEPDDEYHAKKYIRNAVKLAREAENAFIELESVGLANSEYNSKLEAQLKHIQNLVKNDWVHMSLDAIDKAIEMAKKEESLAEKILKIEDIALKDEKKDYDFVVKSLLG